MCLLAYVPQPKGVKAVAQMFQCCTASRTKTKGSAIAKYGSFGKMVRLSHAVPIPLFTTLSWIHRIKHVFRVHMDFFSPTDTTVVLLLVSFCLAAVEPLQEVAEELRVVIGSCERMSRCQVIDVEVDDHPVAWECSACTLVNKWLRLQIMAFLGVGGTCGWWLWSVSWKFQGHKVTMDRNPLVDIDSLVGWRCSSSSKRHFSLGFWRSRRGHEFVSARGRSTPSAKPVVFQSQRPQRIGGHVQHARCWSEHALQRSWKLG